MSFECGIHNGKVYTVFEFQEPVTRFDGTSDYGLWYCHPIIEFKIEGANNFMGSAMDAIWGPKELILDDHIFTLNSGNFNASEMPDEFKGNNDYLPEHLASQYVNFIRFNQIKLRLNYPEPDFDGLPSALLIKYKYYNLLQMGYVDGSSFIAPTFNPVHDGWTENITEEVKALFGIEGKIISPEGQILDE